MRFYSLSLTTTAGKSVTFSSRVPSPSGNGTINNPGALNITFDAPVAPMATPQGLMNVTVWGIGLAQISQAADLNGASFTLVGGMAPGLPLATAASGYAGVLFQGTVYQAYGNWQGINQTLELVVMPGGLPLVTPHGIAFTWQPGQTLASAIVAALGGSFPGYLIDTTGMSQSLVQSQSTAQSGAYQSLSDFSDMILQQSQAIGTATLGPSYPGVQIWVSGNSIVAYDGSASPTTIALQFQDLIGQPTWMALNQVSFKTVLRADIQLGSQITFPTGIQSPYALITPAAAVPGTPVRNASAFKGTFIVQEVHHYGNFRQPDADSWATAFVANPARA